VLLLSVHLYRIHPKMLRVIIPKNSFHSVSCCGLKCTNSGSPLSLISKKAQINHWW